MAVRRKTVLVVDSEKAVTDTLVAIFERAGYISIPCYSSDEAIRIIAGVAPDLIISEIFIDRGNGIEVAIAAKTLCPHSKVILMSGNPQAQEMIEKAIALGHSFDILAKPIHPAELLEKMESTALPMPDPPTGIMPESS